MRSTSLSLDKLELDSAWLNSNFTKTIKDVGASEYSRMKMGIHLNGLHDWFIEGAEQN